MSTSYNASDITVLEGLEPVRKRPGMYIGGTGKAGLHHLLWEIVDNSVDEAMNGHASKIQVIVHKDGKSATVVDNGRGIPIDKHPVDGRSALEVILTTLHAGGKFDNKSYTTSGGLHGVGSSVVNALSSKMVATIRRDGQEYQQIYRRGKPLSPLNPIGTARGTGTSIYFEPDDTIFQSTQFDTQLIADQLEIKTFLNKGLRLIFKNEIDGTTTEFRHGGGVADFLTHTLQTRKATNLPGAAFILERDEGIRIELALQWTESTDEVIRSFVNTIPTRDGGTHEQGLKDGLNKAVRNYIDTHNLRPRGVTLTAEDIREGVHAILSVFVADPQFQGQTKGRLNNPEVKALIAQAVRPNLEQFLHDNSTIAEAIVTRILQANRARQASRAAAQSVRRKSAVSHRLNLPGKLADCSSTNPANSELFIVEGDSAGGSAKQGRNRKTQAILPLRGKVLNTEQASLKKLMANKELNDLISAMGCGLGKDFAPEKLRYHKIILLMDADSDGHHIATLLLTFFYRHLRPLIDQGYIYLAQPPLYRVDIGKKTHWAIDDAHKERILGQKRKNAKAEITRFKGLGEMSPNTLKDTTLDPEKRRLLRVCIQDDDRLVTEQVVSNLMGKDPAPRYRLITEEASTVEALDV